MFFYLSKILELLIDPLIWVFVILILSYFKQDKSNSKRLLFGGILLLYFFSNSAVFHQINREWEVQPIDKNALNSSYDVAVVLGGVASFDEENKEIEFHANVDRMLKVLPLYFNGTVEKILLSGGSGRLIFKEKEANTLADYLLQIGVHKDDLIIEDRSRNTYENALYSAELIRKMKLNKVLLSTSAIHMKRSYLCFKKQGIEITPFATDRISYQSTYYFDSYFIPKAGVISNWYWLLHEWVGLFVYQLMGYC